MADFQKGRDYTGEPGMHAGTGRGVYEGGGDKQKNLLIHTANRAFVIYT